MLYTIAVVLLVLWLLGMVTSYTIGGFIHILLVIAIIVGIRITYSSFMYAAPGAA